MTKIKSLKSYRLWAEFSKQMNDNHIGAYASSIAFFTFLSFIPMLMVFFALLPFTPITKATLMEIAVKVVPENYNPLAISLIENMFNKSGTLLSVTILATIWSAGKGILALLQGLNVINCVSERRNYILLRMRACLYTVLMLVLMLVLILMVVFGEKIVRLLIKSVPTMRFVLSLLLEFRPLYVIVMLALFFGAVFTWLPNRENHFLLELPGALFVAAMWYLASWGFSKFVNVFSAFSMYGSLSTVIIAMVWLYMCFYIVLIGALLNRFLEPGFLFLRKRKQDRNQNDASIQ